MSVQAVCGAALERVPQDAEVDLRTWAKRDQCLFTITDHNDNPCLVIDIEPDFSSQIDLALLNHKRLMPGIMLAAGIRYVTIRADEISEILNPESTLDLVSFLKGKIFAEESEPD